LKWREILENQTFLEAGEQAEYARTISADDIRRFAEISGDFAPIHVDEDFAKKTPYGKTIAHGALLMGLLSATSTIIAARSKERGAPGTALLSEHAFGRRKRRSSTPIYMPPLSRPPATARCVKAFSILSAAGLARSLHGTGA
jgi:hypothetical protein